MSQRKLRAALAVAAATGLVVAGTAAPALAAAAMTLSNPTGPSGGGNTIIGTVPAGTFPAGTSPVVQFQFGSSTSTACNTTAKAVAQIAANGATTTAGVLTVDPATVRPISTTKIAFQVPSAVYPPTNTDGTASTINTTGLVLAGTQTSAKWNVCVYDSDSTTGSNLLATGSYTLAAKPTITSIVPAASPAGGGQTITINGTGFSTLGPTITGSIDGVALTNVKPSTTGTSLTATTGVHAPGTGLAVTVVAPGGTVSSLDPDNNPGTNDTPIPFTYSNAITITPDTAPAGTLVNLDITGAGFSSLRFGSGGPTTGQAHVFLVKDVYASSGNRGVAECTNAVAVSDTELACTLDLSSPDSLDPSDSSARPGVPVAQGAYIVTVVADGSLGSSAPNASIVSSGATFTVGPF
jgi:hypothetical protein